MTGGSDDTDRTDLLRVVGACAALVCFAALGGLSSRANAPTVADAPVRTTASAGAPRPGPGAADADVGRRFAALEEGRDARLGVMAIDTGTGRTLSHRGDERFALASTVKVLLAGVVLDRLTTRGLEKRLFWSEADLVPHSPVTEMFVEDGMTVRQLIDAALTLSDNTATNVLFDLVGGPDGVDDRLADLGDTVTSVDRVEPDLNDWEPGERRDTSTPRALADLVHELALGDVLGRADRWLLNDDLGDSLTGARLVRAGVPASWRVGDKSGSASYGTRNNVAVVHPPGRAPWVVVVLTSHETADADTDDELVARATRVVVDHWS